MVYVMNETAAYANIQDLTAQDRIEFYKRELSLLNRPTTFREKVLANVYRCLLQSSMDQHNAKASFVG